MTTRRDILKGTGATTLTLGLAGCLNRLPFVGSDAEDEDEDQDQERDDAGETDHEDDHDNAESSEQEDDPEDTDEDDTDEDDAEDADQETDDEANDDENEDEDDDVEEDTVPDREDVEPDQDDYEDHEQREVVERDPSDIEIDVMGTREENGTVLITGAVTNVSEEYIDAVDIRFEFQDDAGESVGRQLVNVHDIDAGESVEFEEEIFDSELGGPVEAIEITSIEVYGFEDDEDD